MTMQLDLKEFCGRPYDELVQARMARDADIPLPPVVRNEELNRTDWESLLGFDIHTFDWEAYAEQEAKRPRTDRELDFDHYEKAVGTADYLQSRTEMVAKYGDDRMQIVDRGIEAKYELRKLAKEESRESQITEALADLTKTMRELKSELKAELRRPKPVPISVSGKMVKNKKTGEWTMSDIDIEREAD